MTALLVCFAIGCGGAGSDSGSDDSAPAPTDALKATLSSIAETGEVGSAEIEIQNALATLSESDPARAAELTEKLQPIYQSSPAKVKKTAQEVVDEL